MTGGRVECAAGRFRFADSLSGRPYSDFAMAVVQTEQAGHDET